MRPLIDGDVLRYEVGAIGEIDGLRSFDFVAEVLDGKIRDICNAAGGDEPPVVYLTGKTNFRDVIAVTKPYKGNRDSKKPYHFQNITVYMHNQYDVRIQEGLEADDLMAIELTKDPLNNVVCTRDKDLRMVPGWHYGWECGAQREMGPILVENPGMLSLTKGKSGYKLTGTGDMFFYAQLLTGDTVDNIPGCPLVGAVKAYDILTEDVDLSPFHKVLRSYQSKNLSDEYLMEQAHLLWMVRELDENGGPVLWTPPV